MIADFNNSFDADFVNRSASVVHTLGEIRNCRGDISHGKLYPKEEESTDLFAGLVQVMAESIMIYILNSFFEIDLSYKELLQYEDLEDFNDYLDSQSELEDILYSKALYDQDYTKYNEMYIDYIESKEGDDNE